MAECIHGFEGTLCDQCFPKEKPEPPKRPTTRSSTRPTHRAAGAARPSHPAALVTGDVRIYHITHVRNLASIIAAGELRASAEPIVDISSDLARELRATAEAAPGRPVSGFVPFALTPDSLPWDELRRGAAEPRWSAAARAASPTDFVFLVSTIRSLGDDAVIADGDAAGTYTRFATSADERERMLVRLHNDPDARLSAEALAPDAFDFGAIQLIGVANEPVRDEVRSLLVDSGFVPKVAVYPPWFILEA